MAAPSLGASVAPLPALPPRTGKKVFGKYATFLNKHFPGALGQTGVASATSASTKTAKASNDESVTDGGEGENPGTASENQANANHRAPKPRTRRTFDESERSLEQQTAAPTSASAHISAFRSLMASALADIRKRGPEENYIKTESARPDRSSPQEAELLPDATRAPEKTSLPAARVKNAALEPPENLPSNNGPPPISSVSPVRSQIVLLNSATTSEQRSQCSADKSGTSRGGVGERNSTDNGVREPSAAREEMLEDVAAPREEMLEHVAEPLNKAAPAVNALIGAAVAGGSKSPSIEILRNATVAARDEGVDESACLSCESGSGAQHLRPPGHAAQRPTAFAAAKSPLFSLAQAPPEGEEAQLLVTAAASIERKRLATGASSCIVVQSRVLLVEEAPIAAAAASGAWGLHNSSHGTGSARATGAPLPYPTRGLLPTFSEPPTATGRALCGDGRELPVLYHATSPRDPRRALMETAQILDTPLDSTLDAPLHTSLDTTLDRFNPTFATTRFHAEEMNVRPRPELTAFNQALGVPTESSRRRLDDRSSQQRVVSTSPVEFFAGGGSNINASDEHRKGGERCRESGRPPLYVPNAPVTARGPPAYWEPSAAVELSQVQPSSARDPSLGLGWAPQRAAARATLDAAPLAPPSVTPRKAAPVAPAPVAETTGDLADGFRVPRLTEQGFGGVERIAAHERHRQPLGPTATPAPAPAAPLPAPLPAPLTAAPLPAPLPASPLASASGPGFPAGPVVRNSFTACALIPRGVSAAAGVTGHSTRSSPANPGLERPEGQLQGFARYPAQGLPNQPTLQPEQQTSGKNSQTQNSMPNAQLQGGTIGAFTQALLPEDRNQSARYQSRPGAIGASGAAGPWFAGLPAVPQMLTPIYADAHVAPRGDEPAGSRGPPPLPPVSQMWTVRESPLAGAAGGARTVGGAGPSAGPTQPFEATPFLPAHLEASGRDPAGFAVASAGETNVEQDAVTGGPACRTRECRRAHRRRSPRRAQKPVDHCERSHLSRGSQKRVDAEDSGRSRAEYRGEDASVGTGHRHDDGVLRRARDRAAHSRPRGLLRSPREAPPQGTTPVKHRHPASRLLPKKDLLQPEKGVSRPGGGPEPTTRSYLPPSGDFSERPRHDSPSRWRGAAAFENGAVAGYVPPPPTCSWC